MADAALAPRVRMITICDEITASEIEAGVFSLEGVRQDLYAATFPFRVELNVLLLLSSARKGRYPGTIKIVWDSKDRVVRLVEFLATFQVDNDSIFVPVEVGNCPFPEPGYYTAQIWFSARDGGETMRGEQPFIVYSDED